MEGLNIKGRWSSYINVEKSSYASLFDGKYYSRKLYFESFLVHLQ
jgi:hypothetical protein